MQITFLKKLIIIIILKRGQLYIKDIIVKKIDNFFPNQKIDLIYK